MGDEWELVRDWTVLYLERLKGSGVARIVMNRPEKHNALTRQLIDAYLEALSEVRADKDLIAVITRGSGPSFSSGNDLKDLRDRGLEDWDLSTPATRLYETVRTFPRITIAQGHGYCLGGALALLNAHDLAVAAVSAKIGMPEILRGSYGQNVTATTFHAGIPNKKAAYLQLTGRNLSGPEASTVGLVSLAVPDDELEAQTTTLAREIAGRHPAALQHAKIAVQLGRDLPLPHALQVDRLVTARMRTAIDPFQDVDQFLRSQKGGTNVEYRRPDSGQTGKS
jgi:enoyl-CoA hydratase/carnithine racemase